LFRRSKPFNLPNFSHGTAGVTYVLATVGSLARDEALLAGAQAGFEYIRSIAEVDDGILRIPYGWGSDAWDGLYEFGWAHGLAGDAVLFQRLQQVGIEPQLASEYEDFVKDTLVSIGLPDAVADPFAEPSTPLGQRFGRAGVLVLLSQWSTVEPAASDIVDLRNAFWHHIESAAVRGGGRAHWEVDAPEFMGGGRAAYTGLLHGAAGIGLALLRLHSSMTLQAPYLLLPDDAAAWADR
jgi:hypothetical protein